MRSLHLEKRFIFWRFVSPTIGALHMGPTERLYLPDPLWTPDSAVIGVMDF